MSYADVLLGALTIGLVAYLGVTALVYGRTRDPGLAIVLLLASYWSVLGAFPLLVSKRTEGGFIYTYMESRLFPIMIDGAYAITLLVYLSFLLASGGLALVTTRRWGTSRSDDGWAQLAGRFSHGTLVTVVGSLTAAKLVVMALIIRAAGGSGASLYVATRTVKGDAAGYLRIYQYLNIITSYSLACGLALWLGYRSTQSLSRPIRAWLWLAYLALAAEVIGENAVLGNRAVPLIVMAAAATGWIRWTFMASPGRKRWTLAARFGSLVAVGLLVLGTIGVSRGGSLSSPAAVAEAMASNATRIGNVAGQVFGSSELIASHMSLYGIVRQDELILQPFVPNSYAAYADLVAAPEDQVFTVHYVGAWWLRIGPWGVVAATVTFALVLAALQRLASNARGLIRGALAVPAAVLPAAGVPITLLRSGPESLRAVFVELVLLPGMVCLAALWWGSGRSARRVRRIAASASPPALLPTRVADAPSATSLEPDK